MLQMPFLSKWELIWPISRLKISKMSKQNAFLAKILRVNRFNMQKWSSTNISLQRPLARAITDISNLGSPEYEMFCSF